MLNDGKDKNKISKDKNFKYLIKLLFKKLIQK